LDAKEDVEVDSLHVKRISIKDLVGYPSKAMVQYSPLGEAAATAVEVENIDEAGVAAEL
jgi:hypothetical protein